MADENDSRFGNVPSRLTEAVRSLPTSLRERPHRYTAAGSLLFIEYLGRPPNDPALQPFLGWDRCLESGEFGLRMAQIGDALFGLRNEQGFNDICRRLGSRSLRSTWFEACSAQLFKSRGFSIHARKEEGIRGEDFDFTAVHDEIRVHVEVTALEAPKFSRKTVLSALGKKRQQLPPSGPSVIVCYYPEAWWDQANVDDELAIVSDKFMRGTGRVNYVEFLSERKTPMPDGSIRLTFSSSFAANRQPRSYCEFLENAMQAVIHNPNAYALGVNDESSRLLDVRREFFEWVDWALGDEDGCAT